MLQAMMGCRPSRGGEERRMRLRAAEGGRPVREAKASLGGARLAQAEARAGWGEAAAERKAPRPAEGARGG